MAKLLEQGLTKEHAHCEDTIITVIVIIISFLLLKVKERAQMCLRAYSMTLLQFKLILIPFHKLSLLVIGG